MTYPRHLTVAQRRQVDHARDIAAMREEDDQINAELRRRSGVTTKKTKYGPVERPAVSDDDDRVLDQWQEQIDSALNVAKAAMEREQTLNTTTTTDPNRFPVMKGQQS
jgi:hypothetical protein